MFIKRIEIERFRCVLKDSLACDDLTALVGRNGAGKSCFLHALRHFYAVAPVVTDEDFYNRETGEPLQIRVTFGGLLPEESAKFGPFMDGADFIVTKKITYADGKSIAKTYAASRQHPRFATVRRIDGKRDLKDAFNELVDGGLFHGLEHANGAPDAELKMAEWEAGHPNDCTPIDREVQLLGPASIGVGSLDNLTKFVFVPAVRDIAEETGDAKGSALSALLDLVVNERVESRAELCELRELLKARYEAIFAPGNHPELDRLAAEVSGVLAGFHPGASLELAWRKASPPEIAVPGVDPTPVEDGFRGHASRKGHGLQRALILALLQARASTVADEAPGVEEGPPETPPPNAGIHRRRLILAIEEPELYQHPQQCRHWARVLRSITKRSEGQDAPDTQVIFTTHSPHFVDLSWFDQVRVIRKDAGTPGAPPTAKSYQTTLDAVAQELADATGQPKAAFTARSTRARARPVMTSLVNEGFFAKAAVLVEGSTEAGLLQEVARQKNLSWDANGIAVVDVGGKTKLSTPLVVFRKIGIPVYLVFDADAHKQSTDHATQNRLLLKLLGVAETDYPVEDAFERYAVVGEEMVKHLRASLGEHEYSRIADSVAAELGYAGSNDAMKNVEAAALFASKVYEEGLSLSFLERIVDHVAALL